ncbi:MAG: SDR family NAD(P)-dependent oxidoreductase [Alphaproteobacteria bacterium]|nr:SDR family NAD(P)-dependent oxidoreductase [Alphaproteobacteria bacterium]
MKKPQTIVITGASSGLGAALAREYAEKGVTLALTGRDKARLDAVAKECHARGAHVRSAVLDIRDAEAVRQWLAKVSESSPIELVIANAGISAGTGEHKEMESAAQVKDIFDINVQGVFNTILPVIPQMQARRKGQIAIISSLAGVVGLPGSPAYSASKAAVRVYGDALRGLLKKDGIRVSVVNPGFIKTPMTDVNDYPMPMIMPAEKAAKKIVHGLTYNHGVIGFPMLLFGLLSMLSVYPYFLRDWLFNKLPGKSKK